MDINSATLNALFISFDMQYQAIYTQTPRYLDDLATTIPVTTTTLRFPWMGRVPTMRKWINDRVVNNVMNKFYDVTPDLFELTIGLSKSDIDDDQFGIFRSNVIPQMADQAAKWPDYTIAQFILDNGNWADGLPFFSASHPINIDKAATTYANDYTSKALTWNNYAFLRAKMMAQVGDDGKSLGVRPNKLIVPPQLEQEALMIVKAEQVAFQNVTPNETAVGGYTNIYRDSAQVVMIPELTSQPTQWYLADTSKPVKPFIWVQREAPSFAMRIDPNDPNVFNKNEYLYGLRARGAGGGGFPFLISRATA